MLQEELKHRGRSPLPFTFSETNYPIVLFRPYDTGA